MPTQCQFACASPIDGVCECELVNRRNVVTIFNIFCMCLLNSRDTNCSYQMTGVNAVSVCREYTSQFEWKLTLYSPLSHSRIRTKHTLTEIDSHIIYTCSTAKYTCSTQRFYSTWCEWIQQFYPSHDSHFQSVHVQTFGREQEFRAHDTFFQLILKQFRHTNFTRKLVAIFREKAFSLILWMNVNQIENCKKKIKSIWNLTRANEIKFKLIYLFCGWLFLSINDELYALHFVFRDIARHIKKFKSEINRKPSEGKSYKGKLTATTQLFAITLDLFPNKYYHHTSVHCAVMDH